MLPSSVLKPDHCKPHWYLTLLTLTDDSDAYEEGIQFPVDMGMTVGSQYDWGLRTIPQNHLDGQTRPIPQGRGVGGGSLINGMIWNRGHMDDFRAWEALGNEGWGWEEMLGYFRKVVIHGIRLSHQRQADCI